MKKRSFLKELVVIALCVVCALALYIVWHVPSFAMGNSYTYYYGTNSSALMSTVTEFTWKGSGVCGESVVYSGTVDRELLERYRATVLFSEEVCDVVNYYCYSPLFSSSIFLCGEAVNLHIAVGHEQTAVGTPLIFGGF